MMISTTFVLFLISTLYPKFSRKLLPLVSSLTYCLTPYLRHSNLPTACHNPLLSIHNELILSTERGEVTSLIHLHLSAVDHLLSIISSLIIIFEIGSVFMALLLTGFHLILPHVLRQSTSKIPLHFSQIFLVEYLKVPTLTHFFTIFIQSLLALSSPRTQPNTTFMSMTPSYTSLSLIQIQLLQ